METWWKPGEFQVKPENHCNHWVLCHLNRTQGTLLVVFAAHLCPKRTRGSLPAAKPSVCPSPLQPIKAPLTSGLDQGVLDGDGSAWGTSTIEPLQIADADNLVDDIEPRLLMVQTQYLEGLQELVFYL